MTVPVFRLDECLRLLDQWRQADIDYLLESSRRFKAAGDLESAERERDLAHRIRWQLIESRRARRVDAEGEAP